MAWLEQKPSGHYHVAFRFEGQKYKKSLHTTVSKVANARLHRLEENISLVESGRLKLPDDSEVTSFLLSDGNLNGNQSKNKVVLRNLSQFFDAFLESIPFGSLEANTLSSIHIHLRHLKRIFGVRFSLREITLENLQSYVDRRSREQGIRGKALSPVTIKKEITTLRTVWNWAQHADHVSKPFPIKGLRYPKTSEKPPFQTWQQITKKIKSGNFTSAEEQELWDTLFLTTQEITQLLTEIKVTALHPCIYPMFVFAAHTGARRSEIKRSVVDDIDLVNHSVTIREKKRSKGKSTTRRVPISCPFCETLIHFSVEFVMIWFSFSCFQNLGGKSWRKDSGMLVRNDTGGRFLGVRLIAG